jgi:hypothetical protein
MVQNGDETGVDCGGTTCPPCAGGPAPTVSALDRTVADVGESLVITGTGFTGTTDVLVGGVAQTFTVNSDTQITIAGVADTAPLGPQQIVVANANGASTPFDLTVIRLQISEIDGDTTGSTETAEFVEISAGAPNVSLAGYTLVFWNGSGDTSYRAIELNGTTNASGLLLVGNAGVSPAPAITFPNSTLQNGPDGVAIYRALPAAIPNATPLAGAPAALIDAVVYGTADPADAELLNGLISSDMAFAGRVQVDEGTNPAPSESQSLQRCGNGRRSGLKFVAGAPTPGAANGVAACN